MTDDNLYTGRGSGYASGREEALARKTSDISSTLYNAGLGLAKNGDLSGAIEALEKSLEFYKKNIEARNLLGLCYYAVGKIGDALSHWIISLAYKKDNNPADAYLNDLQDNSRHFDRLSDSLKLYNQALSYLKQGNEDMAIIRLKKCTEYNPSFVDAYNLLALGYMMTGEKQSALGSVKKALEIDAANKNALAYYAELAGGKLKQGQKTLPGRKEASLPSRLNENDRKHFTNNLPISEVLFFFIGVVITFAIFYMLVMPGAVSSRDKEIENLKDEASIRAAAATDTITSKDERIEELLGNISEKDEEISGLNAAVERQDRAQRVYSAMYYFYQEKYEAAFNIAKDIKTDDLPIDIFELHETALYESGTKLETQYYNKGLTEYNASRWSTAKENFEAAIVFSREDSKVLDTMLYYLGRIAERENDTDTARAYYERLISEFPNSGQLKNAQQRLNNLR